MLGIDYCVPHIVRKTHHDLISIYIEVYVMDFCRFVMETNVVGLFYIAKLNQTP